MPDERRTKAAALPLTPGVYIMRDREGKVIYVGKAKKLKNRVSQYFARTDHPRKVANMVRNAADFEVILTDTELEALVLENNLIKKYKPKYNILLKDDKGYPFVRIDPREEYPRLTVEGKRAKDGARYFGPYGGRAAAHFAVETIGEALRLPACSRRFPRDIGKGRPCIRAQIGRCDAPCAGRISAEEYRRRIAEAEKLLQGRTGELLSELSRDMLAAAEEMQFERAAGLRDRMNAVRKLEEKQKIVGGDGNMDIIGVHAAPEGSGIAVLHYMGGTLADKEFFSVPAASGEEAGELAEEFIARFYHEEHTPPPTVLVSALAEGGEVLGDLLRSLAERQVELSVPERGKRRALAVMACENAAEEIARRASAARKSGKALAELGELVGLSVPPHRIEAYDISNTGDVGIVAGMVVLEEGRPARSQYRKFRIRAEGQDDVRAMGETLTRRMAEYKAANPGFDRRPDLILIDGGETQTAEALRVVREAGENIPVFGMKKDDHHRTRALCDAGGGEYALTASPGLFALVGSLQEEVHRYAVTFHRTVRDSRLSKSVLDDIPGVGPARKKALLKHFGSLRAVKAASQEALEKIVPASVAAAIRARFEERKEKP
ncbi:MAG: excinuclease ABC subunit UvrC [Clostridia bacterium]|nr:excinuclease ABC subunit UvrC [Clostridia bacterium]